MVQAEGEPIKRGEEYSKDREGGQTIDNLFDRDIRTAVRSPRIVPFPRHGWELFFLLAVFRPR